MRSPKALRQLIVFPYVAYQSSCDIQHTDAAALAFLSVCGQCPNSFHRVGLCRVRVGRIYALVGPSVITSCVMAVLDVLCRVLYQGTECEGQQLRVKCG